MLLTVPDILHADEVRQIRAQLATAAWGDGRASAGEQAARVKNNEQLPHDCEAARTARAMVLRGLDRQPLFLTAALPKKVFTPRFNRYGGQSNHYGEHVDNAVRFTDSGQRVRTDVSCTVFLSDPSDYDGGELVIRDTFGTHQVKLPAGHAVLYPGTSVHQVTPVTRGERLACFFWVESMVRSDEQRRLLFDMDMALMQLRQAHGESSATVALTGTYHNLLRLWADT
ncbi:MAG: Fe2+-dependent dioxygenase [Ramlibacter sp.]|nr:Fe2+-dependent dioxygenase [Ramlibacter sp.]MCW5650393.1 Fe2+-dependent dioxygenase [Ramlibacter sp.]